jgi:crotonobetainyl-CoA:carnitine CoA-transferase CaiB-like acyl-CoA transferase
MRFRIKSKGGSIMSVLEGVKVLDLTRLLPGPYCTWILSRLGADVIKIEEPDSGDFGRRFIPYLFDLINVGKKNITLNLKKEDGKKIFLDLVSKSDIVVEGFRPGVMDKLGLGYDELKKHNNGIILCSISGYGQDGPYRDLPGHDINYESIAGLMWVDNKKPPVVPKVPFADLCGGTFAALAILARLFGRSKDGKGGYIDIAMTDTVNLLFNISYVASFIDLLGEIPFYNVYKTKDGKFISVGAIEEKFWRNFCSTIERDDFIDKQYDKSIISEISEIFSKKTLEEWLNLFKKEENMVTPVYLPEEVFEDQFIRYRNIYNRDKRILNLPIDNLTTKQDLNKKTSEKGEDSERILIELGYSAEDIEKFKTNGVI